MRIISTAYQVEITTCDGQVHFVFIPSYPSCSGALAPGLAADMHFKSDVIAFVGPACLFALEPVAGLAAYWNTVRHPRQAAEVEQERQCRKCAIKQIVKLDIRP
jgi:hypothetical protein